MSNKFCELIVQAGLDMLNGQYTIETWGNISCRDVETNTIYLTPSGMDYTKISVEDVVSCDINGSIIKGKRKPTIETNLHLAIYKQRPEVNAIIHTHPMCSTVFACIGEDIPLIIDEAAQVLGAPCRTAKYALPGSEELACNCIEALGKKANSCLLMSHGAVCVGESIEAAFKVAKVLEVTAQIYQMIRAIDCKYIPISEENIEKMQYFVKYIYGQR